MPMLLELFVYVFYGYLVLGGIFGVYFVGRGAARIDADAHQMPFALRLLLWPASVALWPLLLGKILDSEKANRRA